MKNAFKDAFRNVLKEFCNRKDFIQNIQNIHTPYDLCYEMINKIPNLDGNILTINLEFVEVLMYDFNIPPEKIWVVTDCKEKTRILKHDRYKGIHVFIGNYLLWKEDTMKFDVIVGNPPYQIKINNTYSISIWDDFVMKSFNILKENGFLCLVHPSGWRNNGGKFENVKKIINEKQIEFLKILSGKESMELFGVETKVDYYIIHNKKTTHKTIVEWMDNSTTKENINQLSFIPNSKLKELMKLTSPLQSERVCLITSSKYTTSKKEMFQNTTSDHKVIRLVRKDGSIEILNSVSPIDHSLKLPKVVWTNTRLTSLGIYIDDKGIYGLTQFCYGISDAPEILPKIAAAMTTKKFKQLMESCIMDAFPCLNLKIMKLFRKDFWKEFVDENGNEKNNI